ncbi:hypothetical protein [Arundinibacter roseus]|uniref:Uncharacterized protein n=1 Tax=Arundinibacter roseus TaxID=2070510 RepID=A0A4R4KCA0_9BACT|nr:hypothetical protein [Arundinibacter roseus]TDB64392.1 hypothetical protein EZE20_11965 [Arundinibacter roseus]
MKMVHEALVIEHDLELSQTVRIEYWTDDNGAFGVPIAEYFDANETLSTEQKARSKAQYSPFTRTASTRGYMINPATGDIVQPDEAGNYPEGSVPERMAWLSVLAENVPGDALSDKVIALIVQSMGTMAANKRL